MSSVAAIETENWKTLGVADGLRLATAISTALVASLLVCDESDAINKGPIAYMDFVDVFIL